MKKLILLLLIAAGVYLWVRHKRQPDVQLAARLVLYCELSERNIKTPERGVDEMFAYFGEQTPGLLSDFGRLLVEIERIGNDRDHDDRARVATRRIRAPLIACRESMERFADAIESDPAAMEKYDRGVERFARTLEILFGEDAARLASPHDLARALTR